MAHRGCSSPQVPGATARPSQRRSSRRRSGTSSSIDLVVDGGAAHYAALSLVLSRCTQRDPCDLDSDYSLVVSVLEPSSLVWGRKRDIRTISVDNVFWHWRWDEDVIGAAEAVLEADLDVGATMAGLSALGSYAEYTPVYLAADQVLWQRVAPPNATLPDRMSSKGRFIQPIVRPILPARKVNQVLLSLSGGLINPVATSVAWRTYLEILRLVVGPGLRTAERLGWQIVLAAPDVLRGVATETLGIAATAFDHAGFMAAMVESSAIAAPMGLATTIEAAQAGVAMFTLPEIHDGNAENYLGPKPRLRTQLQRLPEHLPFGPDWKRRSKAQHVRGLY